VRFEFLRVFPPFVSHSSRNCLKVVLAEVFQPLFLVVFGRTI
jgi:hypothetical protein